MKPSEVLAFLVSAIPEPDVPAIFLWGPPGVGKSDVTRQVAAALGYEFIDRRLALDEPSDLRGLPVPILNLKMTEWFSPEDLPHDQGSRGILMLDELNLALPAVQHAGYQLILDRQLGTYKLPSGWRVIAAGNKEGQGANIYPIPKPLANRFTHVEFELDRDEWCIWAMKNGVLTDIIEFLRFNPGAIFKLTQEGDDVQAFPTPRTWAILSRLLKKNRGRLSKKIITEITRGTVGIGAAHEFEEYLNIREHLPKIEDIFAGRAPKNFLPTQSDLACALIGALVANAGPEHYDALLTYSAEFPSDMSILFTKLLLGKDKAGVQATPAFTAWAHKNRQVITDLYPDGV